MSVRYVNSASRWAPSIVMNSTSSFGEIENEGRRQALSTLLIEAWNDCWIVFSTLSSMSSDLNTSMPRAARPVLK